MKHAWIENNRVRDAVSEDPFTLFCAEVAEHYSNQVPDDILPGASLVEGQWVNPEPLPPPETSGTSTIPLIGPITFQMLFKVEELVAIDAVRETNADIRIFWKLLDDPRTDFVDRNLELVQTMLHNLETGGLLAAGRAEEIIHGSAA